MKLAWLVWYDLASKVSGEKPEFWTEQPDSWRFFVQVAYCEIIPNEG